MRFGRSEFCSSTAPRCADGTEFNGQDLTWQSRSVFDTLEPARITSKNVSKSIDSEQPASIHVCDSSGHGDQTRGHSQKLLASVTDTRHALCDAEQVAGATGTTFAQTTLVRPRSASRNRLMRTRMSGGVVRAAIIRLQQKCKLLLFSSRFRKKGKLIR